jgi:DNA repair protein SbcC/Rad50
MFEKLLIRNFQNIRKAEITFAPDVTTLVGPTDSGKTARLRALNWLLFNEPAGTAFIRQGQEDCEVTLTLDGGHTVMRAVGSGGHNVYKLDGKLYKAFGRTVPEEIAQLLNVGPVNVQEQITLPYFFCLSPGQVSKELNGVINLSVIDQTIGAAAAETRKARMQVEFSAFRLTKARDDRDALKWVEECDADLVNLEDLYTKISEQRSRINSVTSCVRSVSESRSKLEVLKDAKADAANVLGLAETITTQRDRVESVRSLLNDCSQTRKRCESVSKQIVGVEKELHELSKDNCPLCGREWK